MNIQFVYPNTLGLHLQVSDKDLSKRKRESKWDSNYCSEVKSSRWGCSLYLLDTVLMTQCDTVDAVHFTLRCGGFRWTAHSTHVLNDLSSREAQGESPASSLLYFCLLLILQWFQQHAVKGFQAFMSFFLRRSRWAQNEMFHIWQLKVVSVNMFTDLQQNTNWNVSWRLSGDVVAAVIVSSLRFLAKETLKEM